MGNRSDRRGRGRSREGLVSFESEEEQHNAKGHRGQRLERVIEQELRSMVSDDVRDGTAQRARVLRVELSVDYRNARVYWASHTLVALDAREVRTIEGALDRCAGFLRAGLADALAMDRVPQLRFVYEANPPQQWLDEDGALACE